MRLNFELLIVALFITTVISAQDPVQIKGKFKGSDENTLISVYKPVEAYFNMALPDPKSEATIHNGSFKINFVIDKPGFIRLHGKGVPKTYFYAEPGDEIGVTFVKDQYGRVKVSYSGSNAEANNLLVANAPLDNQNFLQYRIPELFQATTGAKLVATIKQELADGTKPFETMLRKKKITQACYSAMMRETEQTIVHWVNVYMKNFLMPDDQVPKVSHLTPGEKDRLAQLIYNEYDPYNSKYDVATRAYDNQMIKSILIEDGVIPDRSNVTPTWAPFAEDFKTIISRLSAIDHAPDSVQMKFMGTSLLSALAFKPMSDTALLKVFNVYYSKFPKSPYIPVITEQLNVDSAEDKSAPATKSAADIHFLLNKTDSMQVQQSKIVDVKSIQELVKKEFAGRPVFVDFWATWCSPCIAEFQHEPGLREFLHKKQIATLYVSIDSENALKKWQKAVNRYQLAGYHYLATKEIRDKLGEWFFGIPRYMLFDSAGELKDDNLPRPASKSELYQRIDQLLEGR